MTRIRKKSRKIQFQIGWGGLIALSISTVCVFLWVFILGFWVGQKLVGRSLDESLQTQVVARTAPAAEEVTSLITEKITRVTPLDNKGKEQLEPRKELFKKKVRDTEDIKRPGHQIKKTKKKGGYFALQIASYRERERANKEAGRWRDKGYQAKVRRVELGPDKVVWYRVHLGDYGSVEEAINFAKNLAQKHNLKSYVIPIRD
jgi:cell division protein FtsN